MATTTEALTKKEAVEMLGAAAEDAEWEHDDVVACFRALYGRSPDDEDGDDGALLSLCYAAGEERQ